MRVGVPKEIKIDEFRVGLTPGAAREYVSSGHEVVVENGAGAGIGASDEDYQKAGAKVLCSAADVFEAADLIVKVKEPQPAERKMLRRGQILFAYLHLAPDPQQTKDLLESGCTAIAYETITDAMGGLPLLAPMSEVAGKLSIEAAGAALRRFSGGKGILLGGVPGVLPATVVIFGGGVVGSNAARVAAGVGANVIILEKSIPRLRILDEQFGGRVRTRYSSKDAVEEELARADVVVGAVLVPGATAPKIISRQLLTLLKPGSVIVDVAIDQGGFAETSRPTTHSDPTYVVDRVVHYCVANMPGAVPLTSSQALNNATLPFGLAIAGGGLASVIKNAHLREGLNIHDGRITSKPVAESLGLPFVQPNDAIGLAA
jgi:alanine dehydrogenase